MKYSKEKNNGITLIALVVTIIVLLILAGVSISTLTGNNGIITQAQSAKENTEKATEEEKIQLSVIGSKTKDNGYSDILDETSFKNELNKQFGNQELDVRANKDGSFIVTVVDTKRKYYINDDLTIINSDNIIEIGTKIKLENFRDDVNNGNSYEGKAVLLTNNINLEGEAWGPIGTYPTKNSTPADETNAPFKGIFDGCGYEVDNFNINTTDKVQGLFGLVNNGKVSNLGIGSNVNISGGTGRAGVIAYAYNGTKIYNCYNNGTISGTDNVSGIVGVAFKDCIISNCHNLSSINGCTSVGGIVGTTRDNILIRNCHNEGTITATAWAGGILGHSQAFDNFCEILLCYNSGNVTANGELDNNSSVGGIVGYNNLANVSNCYNSGTITGQYMNVGGIIGNNHAVLTNSYNSGFVNSSSEQCGAIVGQNIKFHYDGYESSNGKITNCYSLEGTADKLFGLNDSTIGNECSFKSVDELKNLYKILGNAFIKNNTDKNNGFPILSWEETK